MFSLKKTFTDIYKPNTNMYATVFIHANSALITAMATNLLKKIPM